MKLFLACMFIFLATSCTNKNKDSEQILREYISKRFNSKMNLEDSRNYLAKDILLEVENLSDEDSEKFFEQLKISKNSFKVLSKNCSETKCFYTYVIKYKDKTSGLDSSVEVRKIAELHKLDVGWRIVDITNIKTHIESNSVLEK